MNSKLLFGIPTAILTLAAGGYLLADYTIRGTIDERLAEAVENGNYDEIYYEDLSFNLKGDITLLNLHLKDSSVDAVIDKLVFSNLDNTSEIPTRVNLLIEGLTFPNALPDFSNAASGQTSNLLAAIIKGNKIPLTIQYKHDYAPANSHEFNPTFNLNIPDVLNVEMTSLIRNIPLKELGNVDSSDPLRAQMETMRLISAGELPSMEIQFKDYGLVALLLESMAEQSQSDPEAVRAMLSSQVRNMYLFLPQNAQGLAMQTGIQLASFLEGNHSIAISAKPEHMGNIALLQPEIMGAVLTGNINRVWEILNLEIITKELVIP